MHVTGDMVVTSSILMEMLAGLMTLILSKYPRRSLSGENIPSSTHAKDGKLALPPTQVNLFSQDMTPIQGDPLLSEASSIIDIQKTIENAGSEQPGPSLVSEIPSDQQWVNTPQSSEWT